MGSSPAVVIERLTHRYSATVALDGIDLAIDQREIFGLLGPNGGGKTTLFRILSTAMPPQTGSVHVMGFDVARELFEVRRRIGVVFQHPSLDGKLTVRENLIHHARLYGLSRREYLPRIDRSISVVGLSDRNKERVDRLSGGLARRAEIAKGLLHEPALLILDEPSTGLDPAARSDLWRYLGGLPDQGVTVLTTTHWMEEAERCDRIGILDRGKLVALDAPEALRSEIGGDVVTISSSEASSLANQLREQMGVEAVVERDEVRFERSPDNEVIAELLHIAGPSMRSISIAKPTLEDVFLRRTGHQFWADQDGQ